MEYLYFKKWLYSFSRKYVCVIIFENIDIKLKILGLNLVRIKVIY